MDPQIKSFITFGCLIVIFIFMFMTLYNAISRQKKETMYTVAPVYNPYLQGRAELVNGSNL